MKILGYDYKLKCSTEMDTLGQANFKLLRIQIADGYDEQQQVSTVLHEVIECVNYHLKIGLEERDVMGLEAGLYQVLTDAGIDLSPLVKELKE